MQTGAYFNGYNTEKPSSRVLKEPGGGPSDIFGLKTNGSSSAAPTNGTANGNHQEPAAPAPAAAASAPAPAVAPTTPTKQDVPQHILNRQEALANKLKNSCEHGYSPVKGGEVRLATSMRAKDSLTEPPTRQDQQPAAEMKKEESPAPVAVAPTPEPPKQVEEPTKKTEEPEQPAPAPEKVPEQPVTPKKEEPVQQQQQQVTPTGKPRRIGYNPITGESYEDEEVNRQKKYDENDHQRKLQKESSASQPAPAAANVAAAGNVHTSSRVLQPPGGRSTKLW